MEVGACTSLFRQRRSFDEASVSADSLARQDVPCQHGRFDVRGFCRAGDSGRIVAAIRRARNVYVRKWEKEKGRGKARLPPLANFSLAADRGAHVSRRRWTAQYATATRFTTPLHRQCDAIEVLRLQSLPAAPPPLADGGEVGDSVSCGLRGRGHDRLAALRVWYRRPFLAGRDSS